MTSIFTPVTEGAISSILSAVSNGGPGQSSNGEHRVPMEFTSTFRRRNLQQQERDDVSRRTESLAASVPTELGGGALPPARYPHFQDLTGQLNGAMSVIRMKVNPHTIEISEDKRYGTQETMEGNVFHHFTNSKGQNNNLATITFQGNTGDISGQGASKKERLESLSRLKIFHELWQLTREPMSLIDVTGYMERNRFYITIVSPALPVPVEFIGFFTEVLKWSESAEKPFSKDYSMSFIVEEVVGGYGGGMNELSSRIDEVITKATATAEAPAEGSTLLSRVESDLRTPQNFSF